MKRIKKTEAPALAICPETIRNLSPGEIASVQGASKATGCSCTSDGTAVPTPTSTP